MLHDMLSLTYMHTGDRVPLPARQVVPQGRVLPRGHGSIGRHPAAVRGWIGLVEPRIRQLGL